MIKHSRLIALFIFLMMLSAALLPGFTSAVEGRAELKASQAEADESMVEVLILLKEQVNTEAVASIARKNLLLPAGTTPKIKDTVSIAVVEALQKSAERSQAPLLRYLEKEKSRGRVAEIESFFVVNIVYTRISEELADEIARRPEVDSVIPNKSIQLIEPVESTPMPQDSAIEWNISHVKAPDVWALGIDGSGIVVGIIDTGVDWEHEALMQKYRGYGPDGSTSHAYNWFDPYRSAPYPEDYHGHGTHVTGIIVGSDPEGLNQIGVAPGAQWIAARGLNDEDSGKGDPASLLRAGEFLLAPTPNPDGSGTPDPTKAPDIINNSWGGKTSVEEWYRIMVQNWRAAGILPVFAAGNHGPGTATIAFPAQYPESFAVAAIDSNNNLASFSGRGPAPYPAPDDMKPDISAPGVNIRSACSWKPLSEERGYYLSSGTSMAAPHISGVAALLLGNNPGLTVYQLESIMLSTAIALTNSAYPVSPNYGFGYGLVNALAAISSPLPDSFTAYGWNIDDNSPVLPRGPVTVTVPGGALNSIKSSPGSWMSGADFIGNEWYAIGHDANLYQVDPGTGIETLVGATGLSAGSTTGLAYDIKEQVLYASAYVEGESNLYTVEISTGEADYIGCIVMEEKIIGIAANRLGNIYGLNINDNSLYSINKSTGEGLLIGSTGYDLNDAQDIAFDRDNNILYGTLWVDSPIESGGLYMLNTFSGAATMLHHYGARITGLAVPYSCLPFNSDPHLLSLTVSEGTLTPDFSSERTDYLVEVAATVSSIDITATLSDIDASMNINGDLVSSGVVKTIMLGAAGSVTSVNIVVTADDGVTEKSYNLSVSRFDYEPTFTDVPADHEFFEEIEALVALGITTGWSDGTFRPALPVTRQAMAAFLVRAFNLEVSIGPFTEPTFSDVPLGHPFFEEIESIVASQITTGWPDGTFRPTEPVTRQATAAFLYRVLELEDLGVSEPTFSDVPADHPFFTEIEALVAAGITNGWSDGTFGPTLAVTRQAMAAFLIRAVELED